MTKLKSHLAISIISNIARWLFISNDFYIKRLLIIKASSYCDDPSYYKYSDEWLAALVSRYFNHPVHRIAKMCGVNASKNAPARR